MTSQPWRPEYLAEVGSTNSLLVERARAGEAPGLALRTDFQSEGRGRRDREWVTTPGSALLCSVLVAAPPSPVAPQWVVVAGALALADALEVLTGRRPTLKWPNDVLFGDAKVAGLLAEALGSPVTRVVLGSGVNLRDVDPSFSRATTVLAATGVTLEPEQLFVAYLELVSARLAQLEAPEGHDRLHRAYCADLVTLGRRVRVELPEGVRRGLAVDVDSDGALVVEVDGVRESFQAGDVVHLRPEEE